MEIFSYSRLSAYEECPFRFYIKYVEKIKEETTQALALGSAVHKGVELIIRQNMSVEQAVAEAMFSIDFHPDVDVKEVEKLIRNAPIFGRKRVYGQVEQHFTLPLSTEPNSPKLQGFIDLLGTGYKYILDWKTNRVPYSVLDTKQIALYAWAVKELYGVNQVEGALYFLRFRKESRARFTYTEMENARQWAYTLAKEIQSKLALVQVLPDCKEDLFPAKAGRNCTYCPFSLVCLRKFSSFAI